MIYKKFGVVYGIVLAAFTAYVLLDTFVIPTRYTSAETTQTISEYTKTADVNDETDVTLPQYNSESEATESDITAEASSQHEDDVLQENTESTEITENAENTLENEPQASEITENSYSDNNISITLTEYYENNTKIYVADIQLSLADYLKTALAENTYGKNVTQKTSEMAAANNAIIAVNGDYYGAKESGYVIRNGTLYRDYGSSDTDVLCIYSDGHFEITNSSEKTAQ